MSEAAASQSRSCPCTGACCHRYLVNLCGYDVWLVATQLRLRPEEFVVAFSHADPQLGGFQLQRGGKSHGLALDKRRWGSRGKASQRGPCIFLTRMTNGIERCGIHAIRPVACRVYPMSMRNDELTQRSDALCPAGSWVLSEQQKTEWHRWVNHGRMQFDIYAEVLSRWNARVDAAAETAYFSILNFLAYLLNAYDRIERVVERLDTAEMDEIVATWPRSPRLDDFMSIARSARETPLWLRHLDAVRDIVGSFYPELPPQLVPTTRITEDYSQLGESLVLEDRLDLGSDIDH